VIESLIPQLRDRQELAEAQVRQAVEWLAMPTLDAGPKADFLAALAQKGETPAEIAAFARALRDKAHPLTLHPATRAGEILDIVGTGGDRLGTINISTTAALICAAAGVTVAKHGNRAITSQAGSADVLEALGIRTDLTPDEAAEVLRERGFAFLFAPNYHPAFQHIGPARKLCAALGQRTVFNLLGPLLNPARPSAMLMGVPRPELCEPLAMVLQSLGVRRAMVVCGQVGEAGHLDELSTLGANTIAEFYQERGFTVSTTQPEQFPLQPAGLADLVGGDKFANAAIVRRILSGAEQGPKRDAVLLNAAAALFVAGKTKSQAEGWDLAGETIDSGRAAAKLAELVRK
jgi:anthranilate phosphoribosyltransferase